MKHYKANLYSLKVCDGPMDLVHGNNYSIVELYVPSQNIGMNINNDILHVFEVNEDLRKLRYKDAKLIKIVSLDEKIVEMAIDFLKAKENIKRLMSDMFEKENKKLQKKIQKELIKMYGIPTTTTNNTSSTYIKHDCKK